MVVNIYICQVRYVSWSGTYVLNESTLVLEGVTLGGVVQLVVEVLVDLARGTVLDQQTTENSLTAHPKNLPKLLLACIAHQILC